MFVIVRDKILNGDWSKLILNKSISVCFRNNVWTETDI